MAKTAAELIAHLEAGGLIARGEPDHAEYLRFEIFDWQGATQKYLGGYGWGSALGRTEDRLVDVLNSPHGWVCVPAGTREEIERTATSLLAQLGKYENYEWKITVRDERKANVKREQAKG